VRSIAAFIQWEALALLDIRRGKLEKKECKDFIGI
jgi:hypothetical protein